MSFTLKLLLLPALLALVRSDYPLNVEDAAFRNDDDPTVYRVPEDLDPVHFDVEITPYFEAEGDKEAFTFDGDVSIVVKAMVENIQSLILQENVRFITSVTVTDEAGVPIRLNGTLPFERIRQYHFLKINLADGVTLVNQQNYVVRITYIGNINETPLSRGIFRGSYVGSDGNLHWYAASHLQPTHSRQAFPSFDEPGFKSTFSIIVNRPAHFTDTYSNMPIAQRIPIGNRVKEIFHTTPRMSAYLVTIHISEEFSVIADNNDSQRSYRILARPNAAGQGQYALDIGSPITEWLEDYFGINYYSMGEEMKNDQIAVPDWASGATENWGLVSYRELRLLFEEGETNSLDKMYIGTITAHELAHKWFGNLITCRWWDNVWINEGFASYFEYFAMDGIDRDLELEDQFNIMYLQSALSADSAASTRALQHTVNSPTEVTGHFSGISYSKGASLLLMLKHFLTEDTFKKALNYFLVEMSYEHALPEDLYRNFARAVAEDGVLSGDVSISEFMRYWVDEQGYPVLTATVNRDTGVISLEQERFFISATASPTEQAWPLPLTFTTGSSPNWENLRPSHVMTGKTSEVQTTAGNQWVVFNVQQKGIYRVNYDAGNWELLAAALKEDLNQIHHLNRAQIVDDVFALMRSERMTYELGFKVLDFLKQDTSYYSWYPAITGFNWIRNRFLHLPDTLAEYDKELYEFLDAAIAALGYDVTSGEPLTRSLNRFFLLSFACSIGHEGCINDALDKFNAYKNNGASVHPDVRRHVFCTALREGAYEDWQLLRQRRLASNNQAAGVAFLRAMGCTTNAQAIQEYLNLILTDEVKAQDRVNAFTFIFMGDRANARLALPFFRQRIDDVRTGVVLASNFNSVLSSLASYMDEEGLEEMEEWLQASQATIPEYTVGLSAIVSARTSMQWGSERAQMILSAVRGAAAAVLPPTVLLLVAILNLLLK